MMGKLAKPGDHVLFIHVRADGPLVMNGLVDTAMTEPNPVVTLLTIKSAGGYQYRSNVPHLSRRLDAVQSYWCWPEEYTAEKPKGRTRGVS